MEKKLSRWWPLRYENSIRQWELTYLASRKCLEAEVAIAGSDTNTPYRESRKSKRNISQQISFRTPKHESRLVCVQLRIVLVLTQWSSKIGGRPKSTSRSRGEGVREGVTVCDRRKGVKEHVTSHFSNFFIHIIESDI